MADEKTKIPAMERVIINSEECYKHDLQFYEQAPNGSLNFDDLEKLVIDRLLILRMVMMIAEQSYRRPSCHYRKKLIEKLRASGYRTFADLCEGTGCNDIDTIDRYAARRRDHLSQYALLPCMLQSIDMERWIKEAETHLFNWRLSALDSQGILSFKTLNKLPYVRLKDYEKNNLKDCLKRAMKHTSLFDITNFYKVPALDMLEARYIYLKNGIAYATEFQLTTAFQCQYEIRLKSQIREWKSKRNTFLDPRISALKKSLHRMFDLSKPKLPNIGGANIVELDEIAETSYAPCMRRLHEGLRKTHHLRYQGRIEYTLNLKSMGIPAENAVEFYRREFTKIIENSDFDKQYVYGFLHLYGLKGSRVNYPVPNCRKMAVETPKSDEYHGCPFATLDMEDLGKMLIRWNIDSASTSEIVNLAKNKKCTDACARYFKATHDCSVLKPISTPMDFYRQSIKIHNGDGEEIEDKPVVQPSSEDDMFAESESSDEYESENDSDEDYQITEMNNISPQSKDDCEIIDTNNVPVEPNKDVEIIETNYIPVEPNNDFEIIETNYIPVEPNNDFEIIETNNVPAESNNDFEIIETNNVLVESNNSCEVIEINNVSIESNNDYQIIEINNVSSESEDDCQIIETHKAPGQAKSSDYSVAKTKHNDPKIATVPDDDCLRDRVVDLFMASRNPP